MSAFESIRAEILKLSATERRQLAAWLQSLGASPSASGAIFDPGAALYAEIARSMREMGSDLPQWAQFARLKPAFAGAVRNTAIAFDAAIQRQFKGIDRAEHSALRGFLVDCARSRCKDEDRALTVRALLDSLIPLEELLDNRFPEQRTSGQLSPMLLEYVHRLGGNHVR